MRSIVIFLAAFGFYLFYGFYLSQTNLVVIPANLKPESASEFYDYRGVTNVRTDLSNGSSSPLEVINDAKSAGLDFLILTDLNPFDHIESVDGYHGDLFVMTGGEYTFLDARLLYYTLDPLAKPTNPSDASLHFTDILSQKQNDNRESILVLAHPFTEKATWTGEYPTGLDGIEVVNPKAISSRAWIRSKASVIWSLMIYPFNPRYSFLRLFREPVEEVSLWNQLSKGRSTLGFSGADASARAVPWADALMKFPSYQKSFEITNNHILLTSELTGNYQKDRSKIFSALKKGHFYFSLDLLGDPKGFTAFIEDRDKIHLMGERIKFNKNLKLKAKLPILPKDFYEIVLVKNGERDYTVNTSQMEYLITEPGVYRLIVRVSPLLPLPDAKKWMTWIYTNNFYVE
jgi:hypothetical protein